ncbi:MAG TPA: hypothetical protein VFM21_00875 [Terriglobia bacterium]|nr:hypothetical protein [Terriglobia bacterium]
MIHTAILIIAFFQITTKAGGTGCESLQTMKKATYGFHSASLTDSQREEKSKAMDEFWNLVKKQGPKGVDCLTDMLKAEKNDGYFLFDGAALLESLDQSAASTGVVQDAVLRSSFEDVDPAGYVQLALQLSHQGAEIGPLAMKYLTAPKVEAYVPIHAMKLDRVSGGAFLFGSMQPSEIDRYLPQALTAENSEIRDTAALLLSFNMTKEGFEALNSLGVLQSLSPKARKEVLEFIHYKPLEPLPPPKWNREQVLKILRRIPHTEKEYDAIQPELTKYMKKHGPKPGSKKLNSQEMAAQVQKEVEEGEPFLGISGAKMFEESAAQTLTEADLPELRELRRKSLLGVSDESLDEYFAYTRLILAIINRLDLYKELRKP